MNRKILRSVAQLAGVGHSIRTALTSRGLARTAMLAGLLLAGATTFVTASVEPAKAECKYGGPHCITKSPFNPPVVGGAKLPGSGWQDPDCAQFGNCNSSEVKGTEIVHQQPGRTASFGGNHQGKR